MTCFSFYANKTITTGEGGMAVTDNADLAARIRQMSLHGLSRDAWGRYSAGGSWDYRIVAPGYKYNLTDVAAAIGIHQLQRAEEMRVGSRLAMPASTSKLCKRRTNWNCRLIRPTACIRGTFSRSDCAWSGCQWTATR